MCIWQLWLNIRYLLTTSLLPSSCINLVDSKVMWWGTCRQYLPNICDVTILLSWRYTRQFKVIVMWSADVHMAALVEYTLHHNLAVVAVHASVQGLCLSGWPMCIWQLWLNTYTWLNISDVTVPNTLSAVFLRREVVFVKDVQKLLAFNIIITI